VSGGTFSGYVENFRVLFLKPERADCRNEDMSVAEWLGGFGSHHVPQMGTAFRAFGICDWAIMVLDVVAPRRHGAGRISNSRTRTLPVPSPENVLHGQTMARSMPAWISCLARSGFGKPVQNQCVRLHCPDDVLPRSLFVFEMTMIACS